MRIHYEVLPAEKAQLVKDLCNGLMAHQKSKTLIHPDFFDGMSFETRLLPAIKGAKANYIIAAISNGEAVGYAYSNIASKHMYTNNFATLKCDAFFDFDTVKGEYVGCLSQFFIRDGFRNLGIGSVLFQKSMEWLVGQGVNDLFIFVSSGNHDALKFYLNKGFKISHEILDGFITVLRNT